MIKVELCPIVRRDGDSRRSAEQSAVRTALKALGIDAPLAHYPTGAPYLPSYPGLSVSVSHSLTTAAVGISDDRTIGIDIESTRPQLVRVAGRFLSADELAEASSLPDGLLRAWTAKEAIYKAAGKTGVDFARDIKLLPPDFTRANFVPDGQEFAITYRTLPDTQILAVATKLGDTTSAL